MANRDARIYLTGQALSVIGDNALWLAMAIYVKILTGSNSDAGLTFFMFLAGSLLTPVGGVIADRVRRRPLLVGANLANGALVCALFLVRGHGQVWLLYLVMFGYGAIGGLITSAEAALLKVMLPDDLLGEANGLLQIAGVSVRVFTPLLGAGLLAWVGPAPVIGLDAGTFALASLATFALRLREQRPEPSGEPLRAELTAGLRYIGRTTVLRRLMITALCALLVFGFFQVVPFAVVGQGLHRSPPFLGVLDSVMGAGGVLGGLLAAGLMRRTSECALVIGALVACALGSLMLLSNWLPLVLAAMGLVGLCIISANVAVFTLIQRNTPPSLIGRVDATLMMTVVLPQAASVALGATLIAVVNYRLLLVIMAVVFLLSAAPMLGSVEPSPAVAAAAGMLSDQAEPGEVTSSAAD